MRAPSSPRKRPFVASLVALIGVLFCPAAAHGAWTNPTPVTITANARGQYSMLVDGQPQVFVGMGYNPIYRSLSQIQRTMNYQRDFRLLCQAGVNIITGWDADKNYVQDKFDELTLDSAWRDGIGVIMPLYLPPDGDYTDADLNNLIMQTAKTKVQQYKMHPALRMWGVGNEVLPDMPPDMHSTFLQFYLSLADAIHALDPYHPVIYRDAEDEFVPEIAQALTDSGNPRPWLLYGMNVYDKDLAPLLERWPAYGLNRPLIVSEFGWEGSSPGERAQGYSNMWQSIRSHSDFVLGGAPYVWSNAGPEPTDAKWGLMNSLSVPVDDTFARLQRLWQREPKANHTKCA